MTKRKIIIENAKKLFSELGYAHTTFEKISTISKISPGLIRYHFKNKDFLFSCVMSDVIDNLIYRLSADIDPNNSFISNLSNFVDAFFEFATDKVNGYDILLRTLPTEEISDVTSEIVVKLCLTKLMDFFKNFVDQGIKDNLLVNISSTNLASFLYFSLYGVVRAKYLGLDQDLTLLLDSKKIIIGAIRV